MYIFFGYFIEYKGGLEIGVKRRYPRLVCVLVLTF